MCSECSTNTNINPKHLPFRISAQAESSATSTIIHEISFVEKERGFMRPSPMMIFRNAMFRSFRPFQQTKTALRSRTGVAPRGPVICTEKANVAPSSMVSSGVKETGVKCQRKLVDRSTLYPSHGWRLLWETKSTAEQRSDL